MNPKTQIAKSWGNGTQPANAGTYLTAGENFSDPIMVEAIQVGGTVKVFRCSDATEVRQDAARFHYGPLPGISRSIAAKARRATDPAETPAS